MKDDTQAVPATEPRPTNEALSGELIDALKHLGSPFDTLVAADASASGAGQLADSYRVKLHYNQSLGGPHSVFVKLPPSDPDSAATADRIGAFERECYFYSTLLPHLQGVRTPGFVGAIELSGDRVGLVLSDLGTSSRALDQLRDGTVKQAESVISQLADLQAPFWNDVDAAGGSRQFYNRTDDHMDSLAERYARSWHQLRDTVGAGLDAPQREIVELFGSRCHDWAATIRGPRTLVHQDLRLDNLMWTEKSHAVLVDWQTLAFTSPAWDLAFYLGSALTRHDRKRVERSLLAQHVDNLAARGVHNWNLDAAWEEYRRLSGALLLAMVAAMGFVKPTARGYDMFASLVSRGAHQAIDLELIEFLN